MPYLKISDSRLEYLWYGNTYEDRTIYRNVRALEPGHRLVVEEGRSRIDAWWRIEEWLARAPKLMEAQEAGRGGLQAFGARRRQDRAHHDHARLALP